MPSSATFTMKPVKELIARYNNDDLFSIDPFARGARLAKVTNDLDTDFDCDYHMDALEFLQTFEDNSVDLVLFDPPYSPRQVSECYKKMGMTVNIQTTQASFWTKLKTEVARVVKVGGTVISFGWNSGGIGKKNNFEIVEILLVPHGGAHNDTICTVEVKRE